MLSQGSGLGGIPAAIRGGDGGGGGEGGVEGGGGAAAGAKNLSVSLSGWLRLYKKQEDSPLKALPIRCFNSSMHSPRSLNEN